MVAGRKPGAASCDLAEGAGGELAQEHAAARDIWLRLRLARWCRDPSAGGPMAPAVLTGQPHAGRLRRCALKQPCLHAHRSFTEEPCPQICSYEAKTSICIPLAEPMQRNQVPLSVHALQCKREHRALAIFTEQEQQMWPQSSGGCYDAITATHSITALQQCRLCHLQNCARIAETTGTQVKTWRDSKSLPAVSQC